MGGKFYGAYQFQELRPPARSW